MSTLALGCLCSGCLIDTATYQQRRAELTDDDGDGYSDDQGDCDDGDALVYPLATEQCDGRDNDCDGDIDEDAVDASLWYLDSDGDGYGDAGQSAVACAAPAGTVASAGDCDDSLASVSPVGTEVPYDGVDQDCSGADLVDVDGDGWSADLAGGEDCDDSDPLVSPDGVEGWESAYTDRDCDGSLPALTLQVGTEAWTGPMVEARAGARVAALDGTGHFLVSAFLDGSEFDSAGAVFVVAGGRDGALDSQQSVRPDSVLVALGVGLDAANTDADALPEVLLGGPDADDGRGVAYLLDGVAVADGSDLRVPADAVLMVTGTEVAGYAGSQTNFVGDVDGDGVTDLAVSAPYATAQGESGAGLVGIFSSAERDSWVLDDAPILWEGWYADARFGGKVRPAGDQDDDGYDDLLVSGQGGDLALVIPGGVDGSGTAGGSMADVQIFQLWMEHEAGAAVPEPRVIGDVDGDGHLDLVMLNGNSDGWAGFDVRVFTGLTTDPVRSIDDFGARVFGDGSSPFYAAIDLGDRDGDGRDETLITMPERASTTAPWFGVLDGADLVAGAELSAFDLRLQGASTRQGSYLGQRGAVIGDVDGDGHGDLVMGGYGDDAGGENAGHAVVFSMPGAD